LFFLAKIFDNSININSINLAASSSREASGINYCWEERSGSFLFFSTFFKERAMMGKKVIVRATEAVVLIF